MSDHIDRLVDSLSDEQVIELLRGRPSRIRPRRYRPIYPESSSSKLTLGEEFIRKLEEEGDEEEVMKKFINKGKRQPGARSKYVEEYLRNELRKAEEEGRL